MSVDEDEFETDVLPCDPDSITFDPDGACHISDPTTRSSLARAATLLRSEQLVAFPTETVYGLGASAVSSSAVRSIYSAKGRPSDNPLIVHISHPSMLSSLVSPAYLVSASYQALMARFWPGPLTLLFPTDASLVPDATTCGLPTVAVRIPSNPIARALISLSGLPVAAPSANVSGRPSPTLAEHVLNDLGGKVRVVLDGGACGVGVESTVVDGVSPSDGRAIKVLRLGGVGVEEISACLKSADSVDQVKVFHRDFRDEEIEDRPTTPGMKYRHYSPKAKVVILDPRPRRSSANGHVNGRLEPVGLVEVLEAQSEAVRASRPSQTDKPVTIGLMLLDDGLVSPSTLRPPPSTALHVFSLGATPADAARLLFAGLRRLDAVGCDVILVQKVDETGVGAAVMERARKAAGGTDRDTIVVEV